MLIVTNYKEIPLRWRAANGVEGRTVVARSLEDFKEEGEAKDAVFLVNCDPALTMKLALARMTLPGYRRPLIASDLVLRRPGAGLKARLVFAAKRFLLSRADLYLNLFKDTAGLTEAYGIPAARCAYIPFKVNLDPAAVAAVEKREDYVLCFGRSLRDFDTFFAAMERLPYPGAIAAVKPSDLVSHGARFSRSLDQLPPNVAQLPDDGSAQAQLRMLAGAKLVVIPVLKTSIVASGISTALNAMAVGKCVIGSDGPGMSDIFTDEALTVPPEDPEALAAMIDRAWRDDLLRVRTARAGRRLAASLGGEAELIQRIIDKVAQTYG